ncbi:hypothetical protein MTBLM5_90039 [Magnetospirillum sp. LM-5]|nr:hypothetical protein MTBLM5_90039 [Magnetospirillum sp. LM-5]
MLCAHPFGGHAHSLCSCEMSRWSARLRTAPPCLLLLTSPIPPPYKPRFIPENEGGAAMRPSRPGRDAGPRPIGTNPNRRQPGQTYKEPLE